MKNKIMFSLGDYEYLMDKASIGKKIDFINTETFDRVALANRLKELYLSVKSKGICYIDTEGEAMTNIMDSSSVGFQDSLNMFLDILRFCKLYRPNVKFGFYAIPFTTYWDRTEEFYAKNDAIYELINECDYLFPSMYTFYEETEEWVANENENYLIENAQQFIKYNKPVLAFVMHRFHPSNATYKYKEIQIDIWNRDIKRLLSNGADKVVWWGADDYFFRQGDIDYDGTEEQFIEYNDKKLHIRYLSL